MAPADSGDRTYGGINNRSEVPDMNLAKMVVTSVCIHVPPGGKLEAGLSIRTGEPMFLKHLRGLTTKSLNDCRPARDGLGLVLSAY